MVMMKGEARFLGNSEEALVRLIRVSWSRIVISSNVPLPQQHLHGFSSCAIWVWRTATSPASKCSHRVPSSSLAITCSILKRMLAGVLRLDCGQMLPGRYGKLTRWVCPELELERVTVECLSSGQVSSLPWRRQPLVRCRTSPSTHLTAWRTNRPPMSPFLRETV